MKAYIKTSEGTLWPLSQKVTTVGRENCDLNFQYPGLDYQHCIFEYNEQDDCYILQDLNTAQGTYVNDVRVQNAAVRLAAGDVIRFGVNGPSFELYVEDVPTQMSYPTVQSRQAWNQPLTLLSEPAPYPPQTTTTQGLPYLTTTSIATTWSPPTPQGPLPRPPLRSRPLSAGARRPGQDARFQAISSITTATASPPLLRSGGWMAGTTGRAAGPIQNSTMTGNTELMQLVHEKDQKIGQLSDEVSRLRTLEMESFRKDQMMQQLQQQNAEMQACLRQEPSVIMGTDANLQDRLHYLDGEVAAKKTEISALKEQLSRLRAERSEAPARLQEELAERSKELFNLRNELEKIKKDKNITTGLVTQMQRDMSNKDNSISKLTREIEVLKKELREKDIQLSAVNAKVTKLNQSKGSESPKPTEERDARERELVSLRQRFKSAENKIQEQHDLIQSLRDELDKTKQSLFEEKDQQRQMQVSLDQAKSQFLDVQRSERVVRVDLEQASKRLERFRNRIIQVTFSTPGIRAPDKEIGDDELIETLKKLIDERTESTRKINDLKQQLKQAETGTDDLKSNAGKLREQLEKVMNRLKENGRLTGALKQEVEFVHSLTPEDTFVWIRDLLLKLLEDELSWEQAIETALEKCGVNVKLSRDDPAKHIDLLFAKWESAIGEKERLTARIAELEEHHKEELQLRLDALRKEMEDNLADAVEKARLEGEEKLNRAIDDITAVETEKRENAVESERRRIEDLEGNILQLQQSLTDRQVEDQAKLEEASDVVAQLEEYKSVEAKLREEIQQLTEMKEKELAEVRSELEQGGTKHEEEVRSYKEQVKQHSVTICAMEEKLNKVMKKNKDYTEEAAALKKTIQELRAELDSKARKPVPPPKPKVIVERPTEEIVALEHMVTVIRHENTNLKRKVTEQEDVIMGLRRDLSGASARLSDITGEMSESQKQDLERNKQLVKKKEAEMIELRQQMVKLTQIIDKQKEELKSLQVELSKEKAMAAKFKKSLDDSMAQIQELQMQLESEKNEQKKQLEILDHEGRITSELTALGAQCRGERHEQVIMRQRQALVELRQRVKALEVSKPPLPSQDQALQQVTMLKKELAEMRANQALAEDKVLQSVTSLDREIVRARGLVTPSNVEADMERSAHRETMDALECSENSYLTLLRVMAHSLEMEDIQGIKPMAHIPQDERERLLHQREVSCQQLASRIEALKERIGRKDELLQGYERDLAKLRQAQEIAEKKAVQLDTLAHDIRSRTEESQYLRESLNRTRDRLNQEKRLNSAIKQKKTFHLENERAHLQTPVSSRSSRADNQKAFNKKRGQKEMLKRKNYELATLKSDLCSTEQMLHEREKQLYSLEATLGQERPIEVLE